MMTKDEILKKIEAEKVIAIVRGVSHDKCIAAAEAMYAGGIRLLEVPFNAKAPESDEDTAACIAALVKEFGNRSDNMLIGCGTALNLRHVELTAKAGGSFMITPNTDAAVIRHAVELGLIAIPGALTPSEIVTAHDAGASFVKVFPAGNLGADYIKAVRAPLSHIKLMAVGGINEKNFADFLKAGAVGAGFGGNLANKSWIENGEFDKITAVSKQLVEIAKAF